MSYTLSATGDDIEISIDAATREELFRDAVIASLEAAYGGKPEPGDLEGQVVPIQAVGNDDREMLSELVAECLTAVRGSASVLQPPRWLAFDIGRVTANLSSGNARAHPHAMSVHGGLELSGTKARVVLAAAAAH